MNMHGIALLAGVLFSGVVASLQTGCVAGTTYEQVQQASASISVKS